MRNRIRDLSKLGDLPVDDACAVEHQSALDDAAVATCSAAGQDGRRHRRSRHRLTERYQNRPADAVRNWGARRASSARWGGGGGSGGAKPPSDAARFKRGRRSRAGRGAPASGRLRAEGAPARPRRSLRRRRDGHRGVRRGEVPQSTGRSARERPAGAARGVGAPASDGVGGSGGAKPPGFFR